MGISIIIGDINWHYCIHSVWHDTKKADNLFLEMGYVIIGIMIILMVGVFKALSLGPFLFIVVITMLELLFLIII